MLTWYHGDTQVLPVSKAAELLGVSTPRVRRLIRKRRLVKVEGPTVMVTMKSVLQYEQERHERSRTNHAGTR